MTENYWDKKAETMSRDEITALQTAGLNKLVERVYRQVPHYRQKMKDKGIQPDDIKTLGDIRHLPFTTKDDLRETYPFGMFAVPMEEIIRIHATSGTTGKPTVVGYTARDLETWTECMARCFVMAGASPSSRIQVSYGYGLFTGGLGAHYGAEKIGAAVIPASAGKNISTQRQIMMMKDFGTTILCVTPSYAAYMGEAMKEMGVSKDELKLEAGIFGAEAWSENMRIQIEDLLGLKAYDIYGLAEVTGPSVSQECHYQNGLHIWEDIYIVETINPDTCEVLPEGSQGELVFTTLAKEGFPLIRYRSRDISSLNGAPCRCGRHHVRMSRPSGRSDDMLIIRGVNVFPSQIENVLLTIGDASPNYQIIVDRKNNLDTITVEIEVSDALFSDHVKGLEALEHKIGGQIDAVLGVSCRVRLVEPKSIERSEGKAKRVIDKRRI
jgi:phenylacetate-CoA ligase